MDGPGRLAAADGHGPPAARLPHTRLQRNVRGDFAAWHQGRPWFLLWALDVDVPELRPLFLQARQQLAPWLLAGYRRQPHVTLGLSGFPQWLPTGSEADRSAARGGSARGCPLRPQAGTCAEQAGGAPGGRPATGGADVCTPATLRRQLQGLAAAELPPFRIEVGGAGSFTSAPYLCVRHGGALDAVRAALALDPALQHVDDYLPHVTLGLYREAWRAGELLPGLASVDRHPAVTLPVRQLRLLAYAAADVGGPLVTVAIFDLPSRRLRWQPAAGGILGADWLAAC